MNANIPFACDNRVTFVEIPARLGRTHHAVPLASGDSVLGSVHHCGYRAHIPHDAYEGYFREHKYGIAQPDVRSLVSRTGYWVGCQSGAGAISLCRYSPWCAAGQELVDLGAMVSILFLGLGGVILLPFTWLPYSTITPSCRTRTLRIPILSMARANGIAATDVYESHAASRTALAPTSAAWQIRCAFP